MSVVLQISIFGLIKQIQPSKQWKRKIIYAEASGAFAAKTVSEIFV